MGLAVAFGLATVSAGWPTRFSPQVLAIGNDIVMPDSRRSKFKSCREQPPERSCLLGSAVKPNYAIGAIVRPYDAPNP